MKLTTIRNLDCEKVREMCILNDYCTLADNDIYTSILNECCSKRHNISDTDLLEIANRIHMCSDYDLCAGIYGATRKEFLENIVFKLVNDCCYTVIKID